ncbi:hypothetical protein K469DRAFT_321800 [Zopfia rhizophila CBS 207.26]|uniref:Uncharacterized protein n=1 Tax=Zopfia rhizophila CBS 207.26 TaxID=1314779 RepID=A0A6A6DKS0_9PEZI|nr:hypothetical protein K469DRAFT_321800 [Zopfia rhizophila CBS 207.26]
MRLIPGLTERKRRRLLLRSRGMVKPRTSECTNSALSTRSVIMVVGWMLLCVYDPQMYLDDCLIDDTHFRLLDAVKMYKVLEAFQMDRQVKRLHMAISKYIRTYVPPIDEIEKLWLLEHRNPEAPWIINLAESLKRHQRDRNYVAPWKFALQYLLAKHENGALRAITDEGQKNRWEKVQQHAFGA